jgi:hypothetical protein
MKKRMAFTAHSFLLRLVLSITIVLLFVLSSRAGGPKYIAGSTYFDPAATGQPLVWPQGLITYYTDQGDLSPTLPNASANSFVADAFAQWTSVSTAALAASNAGSLAENVSGANVILNADGSVSLPADVQPDAVSTPIGIVYDSDGSVTDALLGIGAGGSTQCFSNAAFGGVDNYGPLPTYSHALIVVNGQCAQQESQLKDVEYRLVRVIGGLLGLGWSQVNPNVFTHVPFPTSEDYAGFPVMHSTDPLNCIPITLCYANPYQLSMDDIAAISRLYPVTSQNLSRFPGKQVFAAVTARIHGSLWFTDTRGTRMQAMQGVNVVARWIDPISGLPSRRYAASSVSGFLFNGNEGNPVTGFTDPLGNPFTRWGSADQALEGFFDLAGLLLPNGGSAQYQLTVEALDPKWAGGVGPYSPGPVAPSGVAQPIIVTVSAGSDVQQDILMGGAAQPLPQSPSTWSAPAALPNAGDWVGTLGSYADVGYFLLPAQANRTLSVAVTALDESTNATVNKLQPVIGMWAASDSPGTVSPAFTPSPFNQSPVGMTRLDAVVATSTNFMIGISDVRGDGRPDYRYHAYVLYADNVSPARIGVNGGPITLQGVGFHPGLTTTIGNTAAAPLSISAGRIMLAAPPHVDGLQNVTVIDPGSGASSVMTGVLTYGAAETDNIILMYGANPPTPVGTQAAKPVSVRVLAADGSTPVSGATIAWSANNGLQLSACNGASSCSVTTDLNGNASTWLTPSVQGVSTTIATLAPGAYSSSKSVRADLYATLLASDIGVIAPNLWIAQGATVSIPLMARVVSYGIPQNNVNVNFTIVDGSGTLSASSAQTNSSGYATVTLTVTQISALVQVSACVAPANTRCQPIYANPIPLSQQNLQPVSGNGQISTGQAFQPTIVRVTDFDPAPNSVIGAGVTFLNTVLRPGGTAPTKGDGETDLDNAAMPVILKVTQSNAITDVNGLASVLPSSNGFSPPLEVDVTVKAGVSAWFNYVLQLYPARAGGN